MGYCLLVKAENRKVPLTLMKWEVYPEAIYEMVKKFNQYPQIKKLMITENGAAFPDELINGEVNDTKRKQYIIDNLAQMLYQYNRTPIVEAKVNFLRIFLIII